MHPHALALDVARALTAVLPPEAGLEVEEVASLVAPPPNPEMGDLAFPCFRLAKALRNAPPKIAASLEASLADMLPSGPIIAAKAAGPYLNLQIDPVRAATVVLAPWARGETPEFAARNERVMVEYSQPNTHKAFHVGHLRNVCLGDCLVRLLRVIGHEVVAANYLGDVGAHIAKCLWGYESLVGKDSQPPAEGKGEWLGQIYSRATTHLEDLEARAKDGDAAAESELDAAKSRMTAILKGIESREPELTNWWNDTRRWSLDEFDEIYAWADVHFDRVFYESEVDEPGLALVEEFLQKGVFYESDGAIGIDNPEVKHMPFFMLRKRDGTGLYSTKDLALARMKFDEFNIDRSLYVVDVRQSDHFRHVFLTLEKMGFEQAKKCGHVAYEMVELTDGPMSSRKNNVMLFRTLREKLLEGTKAPEQLGKYEGEWSSEEIETTARQLSLGAIKYGMLNRDVNQKIVFDMAQWLVPTGNTGTYQQYAAARALSILREADKKGKSLDVAVTAESGTFLGADALPTASERGLMLAIAELPASVEQAAQQLRPTILCAAMHKLAQAYNRFQNDRDCHVIKSEGDVLQGRLLLVTAARAALSWGLDLMGIPTPQRI